MATHLEVMVCVMDSRFIGWRQQVDDTGELNGVW